MQEAFFFFFFFHTRSRRLFLETRGCCTSAAANTQEQEANVSMKVHPIGPRENNPLAGAGAGGQLDPDACMI